MSFKLKNPDGIYFHQKDGRGQLNSFPVSYYIFLFKICFPEFVFLNIYFFKVIVNLLSPYFHLNHFGSAPKHKVCFLWSREPPSWGWTRPRVSRALGLDPQRNWPVGHLSAVRVRPRSGRRGGKWWRSFDLLLPTIGSNESHLCYITAGSSRPINNHH